MKKVIFAILLAVPALAIAQKTGKQYLPPQQQGMPAWAKLLYKENINVFEIDKAFFNFSEQKKLSAAAGTSEILTGEESEDVYTNYYKRWRRFVDAFVQPDGNITIPPQQPSKLSTPTSNQSSSSTWSLLGPIETFWKANDDPTTPPAPWQVNIYSIGIAASNPATIYAGPETGGIFKTTNKGIDWTMVSKDYNIGSVTALAVHPANPNVVYAGTNGQIHKSTDGGTTWTSIVLAIGNVNTVAIKPSNPNIVFAAASNGIFTTTDGGTSWGMVPGMSNNCYDIMFQPGNDTQVYALRKPTGVTQFWLSADGGLTFNLSSGWTTADFTNDGGGRMTVTANNPNRIYAVVLGTAPVTKPYVLTSTDAGANWAVTCTGISTGLTGDNSQPLGMSNGQGFYDLDILANPSNANEVIVATTTAYKSINGGTSFNRIGGYGGSFAIHPDIQEMAAVGNDCWITTDGGLNFSSDFFTSVTNFSPRTKGIHASDFWGFAQAWNEDLAAGGRYHNGNTVLHENYPYGEAIRLGGGEAPTGYSMLGRTGHVAFSDITDVIVPQTRTGFSSNFSFNKYPNEDGYGDDASEVEFFPFCYNHIYTGEGNNLWKSVDGGVSWSIITDFGSRVKKIEICRSNPDVMYVATAASLQKTTNGGASWTLITHPAGTSINRLSITVSFTDENTLWITAPSNAAGTRVFKSTDGGNTWTNLTTPAIDGQSYSNIMHQAGTNGGVYILGNGGKAYYRNNTMADWAPFNSGQPAIFNNQHVRPFYRDGKLRVAGNQGIWQVDFYEDGVPVSQPTVDKLSSSCARDTFYFDDFSAFKHSGGTWAWSFPGAVYISSTSIRNPKVKYGSAGNYDFSLTVTNAAGSNTKTYTGKIQITANDCGIDTIAGKMLTLASAGDYAQQNVPLDITTNTITLSCWIKPSGNQPAYAGLLFSGSGGASGLNFRNNNQLGYHWADGAATYNWNSGPTVSTDVWSHVALVVTPTTATVYLNGIAYTANINHAPVYFNSFFQFGIDRGNSTRNYKGQMDEVCIYNRALSQQEIRDLMNLTRNNPNNGSMPPVDNSLIAYYQFNEGDGKPAYDKIGIRHANLAGAATKTANSTAPVGGGVVQTIATTAGGNVNYNIPGVEMQYPSTGTYPNGDVIVTRLNVPSDVLCLPNVLPTNPNAYFIIRNYGGNATFSNLVKIRLNNIIGTTPAMVATPNQLKLFKRQANDDGATWGTAIDSADAVFDNSGTGAVEFSTNLTLAAFGQFEIGKKLYTPPPPTPVSILTFKATLNSNKTVALDWTTTTETNFNGYDIEHSTNNIGFNKIGFIAGSGGGAYASSHQNPVTGINYYRLKLLYNNNSFTYSDTASVTLSNDKKSITLLSNPNRNGAINIRFNGVVSKNVSIAVTNAAGQLMKVYYLKDLISQQVVKLVTNYAPGAYYLNISFDNGEREKLELLIMR